MMSNEQISNKPLNILKASLPFLPGTAQKLLSYYIKIEEFNILCNNLNAEIDNDVKACDNDSPPNPNDLVKAIKPYLNNSEKELVDMFLNMTNALRMYTTYKSLPAIYNNSTSDTDNQNTSHAEDTTNNDNGKFKDNNINIEMLKNMLSPNQRAMFDTYSAMLNNT